MKRAYRIMLAGAACLLMALTVAGARTIERKPYAPMPSESLRATPQVFIHVPLVRQGNDYTCGVACVQAILRYAQYSFDTREDVLIKMLEANKSEGTRIAAIMNFLNQTAYGDDRVRPVQATLQTGMSVADLVACLNRGKPVICLIQAWASDEQGQPDIHHNYDQEWNSGHYVIAVGYDEQRIYFMDPSTLGNYTYIPKDELDARWHDIDGADAKVEHAGIIITVDNPQYDAAKFYKIL